MLTLSSLTPAAIDDVVMSLRDSDAMELEAAGIADAAAMMHAALPSCAWAELARWNDEPIAMFGVRPLDGNEVGVPWMLTTVHMDRAQQDAVAWAARRAVRRMQREFPALTNLVHKGNAPAIRFIEALGFTLSDQLTGPGFEFRQFWWRRPCAIR